MSKLILEITTSLDGYVAGPDASLDEPDSELVRSSIDAPARS
jgi:hypothetical protein